MKEYIIKGFALMGMQSYDKKGTTFIRKADISVAKINSKGSIKNS